MQSLIIALLRKTVTDPVDCEFNLHSFIKTNYMKKLLIAAAAGLCCFIISCNNSGTAGTASTGSSTDSTAAKYKQINRDILKGIETGDSSKFAGIADDAVDHTGPMGQEVKGGDNIKKMLLDMHNHAKDLKFDVKDEAVNGDNLFTWATMTGTATDSSMGVPANTKFNWTSVDVLKFKDGKASEHWAYLDPKDMMPPSKDNKMMNDPTMKSKK